MTDLEVTSKKRTDLKKMDLEALAALGQTIDKKGKLILGAVLLEARSRFPENVDFGKWVNKNFVNMNRQTSQNLMNLAEFFTDDRPMDGIGLSVGYELSAPKNSEFAIEAYDDLKGKGLKGKEAMEIIDNYRPHLTGEQKVKEAMDTGSIVNYNLHGLDEQQQELFVDEVKKIDAKAEEYRTEKKANFNLEGATDMQIKNANDHVDTYIEETKRRVKIDLRDDITDGDGSKKNAKKAGREGMSYFPTQDEEERIEERESPDIIKVVKGQTKRLQELFKTDGEKSLGFKLRALAKNKEHINDYDLSELRDALKSSLRLGNTILKLFERKDIINE